MRRLNMKLNDIKLLLHSTTGAIQRAIVYDYENNQDVEHGCSVEYAVANYGECEVKRISSYYNCVDGNDYLVITI
jgi:hypothetical protein